MYTIQANNPKGDFKTELKNAYNTGLNNNSVNFGREPFLSTLYCGFSLGTHLDLDEDVISNDDHAKFLKDLCGINLDEYTASKLSDLIEAVIKQGVEKSKLIK